MSLLDLHHLEQYHQTLAEIIIIVDSATDSAIRSSIDEELFQFVSTNTNLVTLILGGQRLSVHSSTILYLISEIFPRIKHLIIQNNSLQYGIENMPMEMYQYCLACDRIDPCADADQFRSIVSAHLKVPKWNILNDKQFFHFVDKHEYVD